MVRNPFQRFTIGVTGDFGDQRPLDKMKHWIQHNGGTVAHEMSTKVTHLICSKEHFKKNVTMVQQARKLKTIKIVSFDWLEDSLMWMRPKNEREYLMAPRVKMAVETKAKKKAVRKDNIAKGLEVFEKGCKEYEKDMLTDGYSIYRDSTTFPYDITLARANLLTNKNERYSLKVCPPTPPPSYLPTPNPTPPPPHKRLPPSSTTNTTTTTQTIISTPLYPMHPHPRPHPRARLVTPRAQRLQLYVTHATPKHYACYVKYSSPNKTPTTEFLAPRGSTWETAWGAWELFFRLKTRRGWEERFLGGVGEGEGKGEGQGGAGVFGYKPPREGEARGVWLGA